MGSFAGGNYIFSNKGILWTEDETENMLKMNLTTTYILASKYLCRSSCVIPAAILKGVEVAVNIFLPSPIAIGFVDGAV